MVSFYIYSPLTKFPKHFGILWITVYNVTTNILELYLLLQNTLSQSEATEPPRTVTSLSSNSLSESGKYLAQNAFPTRSRGQLIPTPRPRASAAKNKLLWVVYTHKESYKVLGTFGNPCESPKDFPMTRKNLLRSSLFHSIMYKYEALPPPI